ncbi:MAG TPA: DUF6496 domain-containing protein [Nannocystaceae bacterium]|nr:DUF6496 domain-containing protein [Nannocystaceae bacterium]
MPEKETLRRAEKDKREGKSPSTQAGEFVREEIHHIREGKHGARSAKQAIAIGLSKARRAGVDLPPPEGEAKTTQRKAASDRKAGKRKTSGTKSRKRARAVTTALQHEGSAAASPTALSRHASASARKRTAADRSAAAKKAARTKGAAGRKAAAKKAARTRARASA